MNKSQKGFTLAELLIALALLGVIAAFTIPKVLMASGAAENIAKAKETISTLEQAWYAQKLQNQFLSADGTLYGAILPLLNSTDTGSGQYGASGGSDYLAAGNALTPSPCASSTFTGYVKFANGVVITGLENGGGLSSGANKITSNLNSDPNAGSSASAGQSNYLICVDLNGNTNGPNALGQDVFYLNFNAYGDFAGNNLPTAASANAKNFYYGGTGSSNTIMAAGSTNTADSAADNSDIGFMTNQGS